MFHNPLFALAVVLVTVSIPAYTQGISASITARVTGPSGAAMAGANVVAKDLDRGTAWHTITNTDGSISGVFRSIGKFYF